MKNQNWFNTLNDALNSEGLIAYWNITNAPINYGETFREVINGRLITIFRDNNGMYERPIHYAI